MLRAQTRTWVGSGEGRQNEDYACADATVGRAVLVDGATGLTGTNLVAGQSDAAWYARELATGALAALVGDARVTGVEALARAGHTVADAYNALPGASALTAAERPNGSAAVVAWDADEVTVTMLGDCTAMVLLRDGSCELVHDATLDALDQLNYARMKAYALERGATMAEARRALNDRFVEHRMLLNAPGGYWAADTSCAGFGHELVRGFCASDVAAVLVCSDGFASAVEMGVAEDFAELVRRVAAGDGEAVGEALRAAEKADATLMAHPRSKVSDDATYVLLVG